MQLTDVVIVGGGVGGGTLATALAEDGLGVLLLERTTRFEDRVRGEWIAPWGVAEAIRLGLHDPLIEAGGHTVTRHVSYDEDGNASAVEQTLPLSSIYPGTDGPLCIEHVILQDTSIERASAAGVEVLRGVSGVEITPGPKPAVRYQHADTGHEIRCKLIVGADGRASSVRRQAGITLHEAPVDHLISGLLIEDAHGWPEDLQSTGRAGGLYYLAFPQSGGKVRLYADYDLSQKNRFAGTGGTREFLAAFDLSCVPHSEALAGGTPAGPCGSFPSQDAWTDVPYCEGVVLIGDAAGYNDPIIGQGLSITLRDVRLVRETLAENLEWEPAGFAPYAAERGERLRRLRQTARFMTELNARFGAGADARRARVQSRLASEPDLGMILLATLVGPDLLPQEVFDEQRITALFDA